MPANTSWALAEALHRQDEPARRAWVEQRLHRLRPGQEQAVLRERAAWPRRRRQAGKVVRQEQNYFAAPAGRLNDPAVADRGWPIGSGAVESACRARQCRRKRPGQFWTSSGLRHLDALEEARDNGHWDQLWLSA